MDEIEFRQAKKDAFAAIQAGDTKAALTFLLDMIQDLNDRLVELQIDEPDEDEDE